MVSYATANYRPSAGSCILATYRLGLQNSIHDIDNATETPQP